MPDETPKYILSAPQGGEVPSGSPPDSQSDKETRSAGRRAED